MAITPKNDTDINVDKISEKTAAGNIAIDDPLVCDEEIQYKDIVAPGSPADGVSVFSESEVLKALTAGGTTTQLTLLPVKYDSDNGITDSSSNTTLRTIATVSLTGVETDDLIFGLGELQCSNTNSAGQVSGVVEIDAVMGKRVFATPAEASSNGQRQTLNPIHVRTGLSGAIDVTLRFAQANAGVAHTSESKLHVFLLKFRS